MSKLSEFDKNRKDEIALTVIEAILLHVAAVGRHSYGLYILLWPVATVGAMYWAVRVYHAWEIVISAQLEDASYNSHDGIVSAKSMAMGASLIRREHGPSLLSLIG